ncbi:MAG: 5-methylcytosine-specific restriction endonuclease system specificity protein McrC [Candidatus Edwardsbacteria bacterium]|nr:5-methylcytosine-specific restriction endonuclease system specificity protein McrC [Candidatus Edwardsbacteria bacterium]
MDIPIENIYYLLCYAFNKLEEGNLVDLDAKDEWKLQDLFASVLVSGVRYLLRRGIDRGYIPEESEGRVLKGRLQISECIKKGSLENGKVFCTYDTFNENVLHNRILKTTICRLIRISSLNEDLRASLKSLMRPLAGISEMPVDKSIFHKVQLNSNNSFYKFLMNICEIIHDNIIVNEEDGRVRFRDFTRDEMQMASLFEEFVRNFYKLEQNRYYVSREYIEWDIAAIDDTSYHGLPRMQTDISLENGQKKIIIDTKFYKDIFQRHYDSENLRQAHLSQLFTYVKQIERKGGVNENCEGYLLYPSVDRPYKKEFITQGHKLKVLTINLNQGWKNVHNDLIAILD